MKSEILKILNELKPGEHFSESDSYVDDDLLDSFDIISLIGVLEEKYEIEIDGDDIIPENFQSLSDIVNLVNKSTKV